MSATVEDEVDAMSAPTGPSVDVRLGELILLESMYPGQCHWDDLQIQHAVSEQNYDLAYHKSITLTFKCDKHLDIICELDVQYPDESVRVHCRVFDGQLPNSVQKQLNQTIGDYIADCKASDCVCDVITVIQRVQELWTDILSNHTIDNNDPSDSSNVPKPIHSPQCKSRYWIYSHHIKSTKKRQMIIDLAQELHLNGFTCVGKPGFICVEGVDSNCDEFWQQIRATNWQRITLIDTEKDLRDTAFDDYNELADTSQLFRVLEQRNCDTIVKNFLGFQSSTATTVANTTTTAAAAAPVAKE